MKDRRYFPVTLSACDEGGRILLFDRMGYRCGQLEREMVGLIVYPELHLAWRAAVVAMKESLIRQMRSQREAYALPWRRWAIRHAGTSRSRQRQMERRAGPGRVVVERSVTTWHGAAIRMRMDLSRKFLMSQPWYAWAHSKRVNFPRRGYGFPS